MLTKWREGRRECKGLIVDGYHYSWMRLFDVFTQMIALPIAASPAPKYTLNLSLPSGSTAYRKTTLGTLHRQGEVPFYQLYSGPISGFSERCLIIVGSLPSNMTQPTWQAVFRSSGQPFSAELQMKRQSPLESRSGGGPLSTSLESKWSALGEKKISPMLSHLVISLLLVTRISESPQKRQWGGQLRINIAPLLEFWQLGNTGPSLSQLFLSVGFLLLAKLRRIEDPLQAVYIMQQKESFGLQTMRGSSVPQLSAKVLGVKTIDSAVIGVNLPSMFSEKVMRLAFCADPPQKTHPSSLQSQSWVRMMSPFLLLVAGEAGIQVGLKTCLQTELFCTRQERIGVESRWTKTTSQVKLNAARIRSEQNKVLDNISNYLITILKLSYFYSLKKTISLSLFIALFMYKKVFDLFIILDRAPIFMGLALIHEKLLLYIIAYSPTLARDTYQLLRSFHLMYGVTRQQVKKGDKSPQILFVFTSQQALQF